jgi:hypothetical protein
MSKQLIFGILYLLTISIKYMKTLRYECLSYPQKPNQWTIYLSSCISGLKYFSNQSRAAMLVLSDQGGIAGILLCKNNGPTASKSRDTLNAFEI